jgi:3-methylcrotonyl-CoA carboxylase alpha subunit/acetyl-CoA/propionyl-CoA carboxylase biotin carboxyl carrier protein
MVANRGEIAARVLRTARDLGLSTVAVYSEADRGAPYLRLADQAVAIGPARAADSYLSSRALLQAAMSTRATAVHPGYGFLSENSAFAQACSQAGLVFVGPPAAVIEQMSRKDNARRIAQAAGLSVLPAAQGDDDEELILAVIESVGFPALIKAVAGGGGKAMHVVGEEAELRARLSSARREAGAAFADPVLLVERFVEHGRHVEVQVAADVQGNVVHLFERDCSVQRRHQKVIEEAPAPSIEGALRDRLCSDAVRLATSVGYLNVGTVEFLVAGGEAYFLEMNTRLQVEHRVTEAVTGLDLVRLQLEIAQGRPLGFTQADVTCSGHAIEVRVYAEDPDQGFLPQAGVPSFVRLSEHALVDATIAEGRAVTTFYDPMLAKIVVSGPTRELARERLVNALDESAVFGVKTNIGFCRRLVASPAFAEAAIDVNTLDRSAEIQAPSDDVDALSAAAVTLAEQGQDSPLGASDGWRLSGPAASFRLYLTGVSDHVVVVDRATGTVILGDRVRAVSVLEKGEGRLLLTIDGQAALFHFAQDPSGVTIGYEGSTYRFDLWRRAVDPERYSRGGDVVCAPMPGVVLSIEVRRGGGVHAGDVLAVLESMKMELPLRSPRDGVVAEICVAEGDHIELDAALVRLEAGDGPGEPTRPAR